MTTTSYFPLEEESVCISTVRFNMNILDHEKNGPKEH